MKDLNFGYLLTQEQEVKSTTEGTYKKPLNVLDNLTKFFLKSMEFALKLHETTKDKEVKNYCKYYLTTCNAVLHILRIQRLAIIYGYYGNVMVLMRTIVNYLNMSMYIYHHPEDAELLLSESRDDFKQNKVYKAKFHEYNLKKELERLGYKIPVEFEDVTKTTHGSLWGAQVFGFRGLKTQSGEYELSYSPKFSITQSSTSLALVLGIPIDFPMYFVQFSKERNIPDYKKLEQEYIEADKQVKFTLDALEKTYQFLKNTPVEVQAAVLQKIEAYNSNKK